MNDRTEDRLRAHLGTVESVTVPTTGDVESAVQRVRRRAERRRRTAGGVVAVALVVGGGVAVWRNASGHERAATAPTETETVVTTGVPSPDTVEITVAAPPSTVVDVPVLVGPEGGWAAIPPNPRGTITGANVIWTGTEAIAVGGTFVDGGDAGVDAYDPSSQQWRIVSLHVPLLAPIVTWTGNEVLAVGWTATGAPRSVAATLDLGTGEWTIGASSPLPDKLWRQNAWVWTGSELLVAPGNDSTAGAPYAAAAYDPALDQWRTLASVPLAPRNQTASVWTGSEWLLWGGSNGTVDYADGAAYDPSTDSWRALPPSPLSARRVPAVWTGREMILAAGFGGGDSTGNNANALSDGAAYDPVTDSWRSISDGPAHPGFAPLWTGRTLLLFAKGGVVAYDPAADEWVSDDLSFGAVSHDDQSPVWTGTAALLLGSYYGDSGGAVFIPPA